MQVGNGDCPHTLFYGPSGAGKKTLILALLREIYGAGVEKLKVECKPWTIELPSRKLEVEFTTVSSAYHVELNPSDVGNNDRYVVQEIIKAFLVLGGLSKGPTERQQKWGARLRRMNEMARNRPVGTDGQRVFKVLVLNEVDRLSKEAQHGLRRTMEKYSAACRLVLCCNNVSKVIEPVRSRCLCVRVRSPSHQEMQDVLERVSLAENLTIPESLLDRLVGSSQRNLRRALLSLEACKAQQYPFSDSQEVPAPDWELYVQEIVGDLTREQTPKNLYLVRGKLYELLVNCIPPEVVLRRLAVELMRKLDDELKHSTAAHAAFYEHRLQEGSKAIMHLEAFVAKFMADYKAFMLTAFG
ncbi:hypothetical protein N2152v2_006190 [Parachlorella kessleri]